MSPSTTTNRKVCFSFAAYARSVIEHLKKCHVPVSKGLSDREFCRIQSRYGFQFPPDLRSILQEGLPVGAGFPDWRSSSPSQLSHMLSLPVHGLCQEIIRGRFWWPNWGQRPANIDDALFVARQAFKLAPVLVPIYSHCYIPCSPNLAGNPIFFIFEKDIFYCGYDLADFFEREVFFPLQPLVSASHGEESNGPYSAYGDNHSSAWEKQNVYRRMMSSIHEDTIMDTMTQEHHFHHSLNGAGRHALNQRLLLEVHNQDARWKHGHYGKESNGEVKFRKSVSDEPLQPLERPPENLVRSAGNSPRLAQSMILMSRYMYFHDQPLPIKFLSEFTIAAPAWAAKTARHIPVWSDLVESKENFNSLNMASMLGVATSARVQSSSVPANRPASFKHELRKSTTLKCLGVYFRDMESRLRKGGWKEDEIGEMMEAVIPDLESLSHKQTRKDVLDALTLNADDMAASLRKAGWTPQDVHEIFSLVKQPSKLNARSSCWPKDAADANGQLTRKVGGKLGDFLAEE